MAISDTDTKILWGRAAGMCSNPNCRSDLTVILDEGNNYNIGEMAHVIAKKPKGPRGRGGSGSDSYGNLILLCPSCHTHIDKAPAKYPEGLLIKWKKNHEIDVRRRVAELVRKLLADLDNLYAEGVNSRNGLIPTVPNFNWSSHHAVLKEWDDRVLALLNSDHVPIRNRSSFRTLNFFDGLYTKASGKSDLQSKMESIWTEKLRRLKIIIDELE